VGILGQKPVRSHNVALKNESSLASNNKTRLATNVTTKNKSNGRFKMRMAVVPIQSANGAFYSPQFATRLQSKLPKWE